MKTVSTLQRIETNLKSEWPSNLGKIQLAFDTTRQKPIGLAPLRLLLGVEVSTYYILVY